jgi:cell division septation protein DedD
MAKLSFGKRRQEDEEIPPEPLDGEVDTPPQDYPETQGRRVSRPLILAGIGVVLIGALYLANSLFFSPPPPPPVLKAAPVPAAPETKAPAPVKEAAPAPVAPSKPETKALSQAPSAPTKATAPSKVPPVGALPIKPEQSAKALPPQTPPSKAPAPGTKADARVAAGVAPSAGGFSIQVGAMAIEQNAENLKQKLEAIGFPATIRKGVGYMNRHIVTAGDPTGKREAEELARRLNVDGFPSQIISVEGKYVPQIGAFVNLDEAIDLAREMQKKNYHPKITSKPSTAMLYQVRTGKFDTRADAMKRGEELKAKGFNAWVVPN